MTSNTLLSPARLLSARKARLLGLTTEALGAYDRVPFASALKSDMLHRCLHLPMQRVWVAGLSLCPCSRCAALPLCGVNIFLALCAWSDLTYTSAVTLC